MRSLLLLLPAALASCSPPAPPLLEQVRCGAEVALACGTQGTPQTLLDVTGNGLALLDVDVDGDLDLLLVDGTTPGSLAAGHDVEHHLLLNVGVRDGVPRFTPAGDAGLHMGGWPMGAAVGDVDRDGLPDLLIGGWGDDALFLNRSEPGGAVRFERRNLPGRISRHEWTTSVALADADADGDLDAFLCRYVELDPAHPPTAPDDLPCTWLGQPVPCGPAGLQAQPDILLSGDGTGRFVDTSAVSGLRDAPPAPGLAVLFADLDDDGWPDLCVINDGAPADLFHNRGDGTFEHGAPLHVTASGRDAPGGGVDLGDVDGDGDLDLAVAQAPDEPLALCRNDGGMRFLAVPAALGGGQAISGLRSWGLHLADFDADGWLDLYTSNGHAFPQADRTDSGTSYRQPQQLFRGGPGGNLQADSFPDHAASAGRASARGDLDGDGDLDLVTLSLDGAPRIYLNRTDRPELQMLVTLEDPRRSALGATLKLRLTEGTRIVQVLSSRGFLSASDRRLHVTGSGPILAASVRWAGGLEQTLDADALAFGQSITVRRGAGVVSRRPLAGVPEP